ncbi:MAG: hypothetical protein J1F40_09520, partial [Prevotellaceae bacterium]|nr:hypothetical protein [Prevotellaceae bacterium]
FFDIRDAQPFPEEGYGGASAFVCVGMWGSRIDYVHLWGWGSWVRGTWDMWCVWHGKRRGS